MPVSALKDPLHGTVPLVGTSVLVPSSEARATSFQTAALERRQIEGTVHAAIEPIEAHTYSLAGEPMIVASGYGAAGVSKASRHAKSTTVPRAVDLINELQEISGQVNRMMAQVERAIDRLAVHAG